MLDTRRAAVVELEGRTNTQCGCPGCMADNHSLDELVTAAQKIAKIQADILYDHYSADGSMNRTGLVTIALDNDCKYRFAACNAFYNTIDKAISRKKSGEVCEQPLVTIN